MAVTGAEHCEQLERPPGHGPGTGFRWSVPAGGLGEKALEVPCQAAVLSSRDVAGKWQSRAKGPRRKRNTRSGVERA